MSGRPQYAIWRGADRAAQPRTPHSARLQDQQQQSEPLLQSSRDSVFPHHELDRAYELDNGPKKPTRRRPPIGLVLGSLAAAALLVLLALSLWKPGVLHEYVVAMDGKVVAVEEEVVKPSPSRTEAVALPAPAVTQPNQVHHDHDHEQSETIDYSEYDSFPLTPAQYLTECQKLHRGRHKHAGYWAAPLHGPADVAQHSTNSRVCSSTITYMLDGAVGLAADVAYASQIAGLARERNRTFFVVDGFWNRGRWTDYFEDVRKTQPGPEPGCLPPPAEEYVACPRVARHWIVSARTAQFHLTHEFFDEFEDPFKAGLPRQRPMFDRARASLEQTIVPNAAMRALITHARPTGQYIGVHMRRGDQLGRAWKYHKGYVPLTVFVDAVRALPGGAVSVWAASDAPVAIDDFHDAAGHSVQVFRLDTALAPAADDSGYAQNDFVAKDAAERARLTRGVLVDLALVSGLWRGSAPAPTAVICTYGSNICRLAAVGLGWQRAFDEQRWVDVDAAGSIEPFWTAFVLYP